MAGTPMKVGIIGCGAISGIYIKNSKLFDAFDILAVADTRLAAAKARAEEVGVTINGLSSSWAPFVVHSVSFLKQGGRLAMVLPAELMHAYYAKPVIKFLSESFREIHILTFRNQPSKVQHAPSNEHRRFHHLRRHRIRQFPRPQPPCPPFTRTNRRQRHRRRARRGGCGPLPCA